MAYSFNLSGGSVLVAVIAHSAGNSCSQVLGGALQGAEIRETVSGEIIVGLSLLALAALTAAATRGRPGPGASRLQTEA